MALAELAHRHRIHTITLQDVLQVNRLVGGEGLFDFERLEAATFHLYSLGASGDVPALALAFVRAVVLQRPFAANNEATALVGAALYLSLNGFSLNLEPGQAAQWLADVASGSGDPSASIVELSNFYVPEQPDVEATALACVRRYAGIMAS